MTDFTIVVEEVHNTITVEDSDGTVIVEQPLNNVVLVSAAQGPVGPPGDFGIEVTFDFGDATPKNIVLILANKLIYAAEIAILTPFNGAASTLSLGDNSNAQRLMQTSEVDAYTAGAYETYPLYKYGVDTQIILTINQGIGCTQGSGIVVLTFQQ